MRQCASRSWPPVNASFTRITCQCPRVGTFLKGERICEQCLISTLLRQKQAAILPNRHRHRLSFEVPKVPADETRWRKVPAAAAAAAAALQIEAKEWSVFIEARDSVASQPSRGRRDSLCGDICVGRTHETVNGAALPAGVGTAPPRFHGSDREREEDRKLFTL